MTLKLCRRHPEAKIDGKRVALTWQAWQLLGFLSEAEGTLSNSELCDLFRLPLGLDACNSHVLQIVQRTRRVLEREGHAGLVETVRGQGYRLRGIT